MPEGNLLAASQSSRSYPAGLLDHKMLQNDKSDERADPVPDQLKEVGDRVIEPATTIDIGITLKRECKLLRRRRLGALTPPQQLARIHIKEL